MALEPVGAQGDFGDEARGRFRLARFIMEAGVKLGLGSLAVATACAAFHRWARAAGPGAPHDPHLMAAAAIFLAAKAQGTPLRARDVLNVTHRLLHPGQPPPGPEGGFWGLRDSLVQCELLLLRVLRFRVPVAHPHKVLSPGLGPSELERILRELLALYSLDATVVAPPPDRQTDAPPPDTHTPTAPPDFPAGTPVADRRTDTQRQQADRDPPGGEGRTEPPRD
ncbi:cyclin-Q isoform X2 [Phaenicophaeus curvirostris]|uniref:cyclin-Q isoform X2 n=1 Tax=Phaenicophaeus curvirostris TaxID=33595 RepID=UPI0037F0BBF2